MCYNRSGLMAGLRTVGVGAGLGNSLRGTTNGAIGLRGFGIYRFP